MKALTERIVKQLNEKNLKRFKMIILFVFIALIALDIVFVFPNGYPTISQVIYDSSPRFSILIFLFGLFVTNVFFQREVETPIHFKRNFIILLLVSALLIAQGFTLKQPAHINCANFQTEIPLAQTPGLTRILCQDHTNGLTQYKNCDCAQLQCNTQVHFKKDLTVGMKLFILLSGIVLGYFLWPSQKKIQALP